MANKVLDGGTAYEITGGKVLDGGTAYEINHGRVMDDGTVYVISFAMPIKVTISGSGDSTYAYVEINGTTYIEAAELEIQPGTVITAGVKNTSNWKNSTIKLDGATVATASGGAAKTYSFTPDCNTVNIDLYYDPTLNSFSRYSTVSITTS